jgi:hypothetical protein
MNEEAKQVSEELNYPIVLGLEIGYNRMEEMILLGSQAIEMLYKRLTARVGELKDMPTPEFPFQKIIGVKRLDLETIRNSTRCATILCHPSGESSMPDKKFIREGHHLLLDGFEFVHAGHEMFSARGWDRPVPKEWDHLLKLSDSDAHGIDSISRGWSVCDRTLTTEDQILDALRYNKANFKTHLEE